MTAKSFSDVTGLVAAYKNAYTPYVTLDGKAVQGNPRESCTPTRQCTSLTQDTCVKHSGAKLSANMTCGAYICLCSKRLELRCLY